MHLIPLQGVRDRKDMARRVSVFDTNGHMYSEVIN